MKNKLFFRVSIACWVVLTIPIALVAQEHGAGPQQEGHHRYSLVDIGTFGGPTSFVNPAGNGGPYINRGGAGVGSAATSVPSDPAMHRLFCSGLDGNIPFVFHGFEWRDGHVNDLGAIPPSAENCSDALAINTRGEIVGGSENGVFDSAVGFTEVRAVRWKDGAIENLGTLGGRHSEATAINNRGQVVGWALNAIPDSFSSLGTQQRAFLWQQGAMHDLGDLGGPDVIAVFVNEHGQIAGASLTNSTPNPVTNFPTAHPFLWEDGRMIDLGSLGGTLGFPNALNDRGQIIGTMTLVGDVTQDIFLWDRGELTDLTQQSGGVIVTANAINDTGEIVGLECLPSGLCDAYLWKNGVTIDLGTLPGDCFSQAFAINAKGQVVGQSFSCDGFGRTFLWESGSMIDLNVFVLPDSVQLAEVLAINDRGEIFGDDLPGDCTGNPQGDDTQCGHAFVLVPCEKEHSDDNGCDAENATAAAIQKNPSVANKILSSQAEVGLNPREIESRIRATFPRRNLLRGWPQK
jgi:probable HAF family extracellular repeat protein